MGNFTILPKVLAVSSPEVFLQLLLFSDIEEEDHIKLLSSSQTELWQGLAHLRQLVSEN